MAETGLVQILEGALMVAGEALSIQRLSQLFDEFDRPANTDLREALDEVGRRCEGRCYELVQVATGYRFQVRQNLSKGWAALAGTPAALFPSTVRNAITYCLSPADYARRN